MTGTQLHLPAGSTAQGPYDTVVDPGERDRWEHTGLRVLALEPGGRAEIGTARTELMVVPLSGACTVTVSDARGVHGSAPGAFGNRVPRASPPQCTKSGCAGGRIM